MWRFIIVTITLALTAVVARPLDSLEDPYWSSNFIKLPRKSAINTNILKKWPRDSSIDTGKKKESYYI